MRILERDKQEVYFAKFTGKSERMKTVGSASIRTGEYDLTYSEPQSERVYVSIPRSTRQGKSQAVLEAIGNVTHYNRLIYSDKDLGLGIDDLFWVDIPTQVNGEAVKPNYRIESIGKSFNHFIYAIKEL